MGPSLLVYSTCEAPANDQRLASAFMSDSSPWTVRTAVREARVLLHWPRVAADPTLVDSDEGFVAIANTFNRITKYVATHSPDTLSWQNSQALGNDIPAAVRQMKQGSGPDLLTQGSSDLLQTLMANDLIDEFRLLIYPIVLGKGKRLFDRGTLPGAFKVTKSVTSPNGVLIVNYARAGEIKTGSFALAEPTEEEMKRRQKIR